MARVKDMMMEQEENMFQDKEMLIRGVCGDIIQLADHLEKYPGVSDEHYAWLLNAANRMKKILNDQKELIDG